MAQATMKDVKEYFGLLPGQTLKSFTEEWKALTETDKEQIKNGLGDGSLTY